MTPSPHRTAAPSSATRTLDRPVLSECAGSGILGRTVGAQDAVQRGLADQVGTFQETAREVGERASARFLNTADDVAATSPPTMEWAMS